MPRPERKSFAQIIKDEFTETPDTSIARPSAKAPGPEYGMDSPAISKYFESTPVRRAREFTGASPVIEKRSTDAEDSSTVDQLVAELGALTDAELDILREAQIAAEAESDAALHGWEQPTYEEYVDFRDDLEETDTETSVFDEADPFAWLGQS